MSADVTVRLTAALADRYRVERELGAGGMATVYLARDLKHDRDVAIKVLHPELAAALGSERFLSEIKTTARLQHPHILPLLDSGEAGGFLYYVMPYVSGETLRTRLEREHQLPVDDALRITREVADALGSAHAIGIIHRDIKPENILLQGGHALVADFGIALAVQQAGGQRMTQTGLSLGTPQYMSPEQAMGEKSVDLRADLYALGVMTYEMLTGDPPFTGSTVQAIVARVMTEEPRPITAQRKSVPEQVEAAVLRALEKLPADRPASAAAFIQLLDSGAPGETGRATRASRARPTATRLPIAMAAAAFAVLGLGGGFLIRSRMTVPPPTSRQQAVLWQHPVPDGFVAGAAFVSTQAAIAPDGSSIVYADLAGGGWMLMRKRRESAAAEPLAGTEGGVSPFFSPDGKWLGFVTLDGKIRKMPAEGGSPITVSETVPTDYKAAAWLDDGTVVYAGSKMMSVSVAGGAAPRALRIPERVLNSIMAVAPLPGSRGFLFTGCAGNCSYAAQAYVYDLAADSTRLLLPEASGVWYAPTGHLLFTGREGGLFAAGFDPKRLVLTSEAVPVVDGVRRGSLTLSASGAALYSLDQSATALEELVWVDRAGRTTPFDSTWRGRFDYPALSPDGRSLAVSVRDKATDLWIRRGDGSRIKVSAPGLVNWRPSWLPDGRSLVFVSVSGQGRDSSDVSIYRVDADAATAATPFFVHRYSVFEAEVTADSAWMVFRTDEANGTGNIYARPFRGDTASRPIVITPANELQPSLSPNGKWLAYTTDPQGVREVFVISFPAGGAGRLVSRGGGSEPRWSRSGRELFFESDGKLVAVNVGAGATLEVSEPKPLFPLLGYRRARNRPEYDVAPGDQRFLMIKEPPSPSMPTVVYVENWFTELLAKVKR